MFVHMPPNSTKNTKNSGFRHIVFFVFEGRAMVDIGQPDLDMAWQALQHWPLKVPIERNYETQNRCTTRCFRYHQAEIKRSIARVALMGSHSDVRGHTLNKGLPPTIPLKKGCRSSVGGLRKEPSG